MEVKELIKELEKLDQESKIGSVSCCNKCKKIELLNEVEIISKETLVEFKNDYNYKCITHIRYDYYL